MQAGIVGLPNVGKSTLFNAVTRTRGAQAENYPFCTIEPNVGVVAVPDSRLDVLAEISKSQKSIPAAIEFVDIAGLVAGASQGEGLGNQFLANIREVDAIVHVVRCFDSEDIHHVSGSVDPLRDIEVINTELVLADHAACSKRLEKNQRKAKGGDKEAIAEIAVLEKLLPHLDQGRPAITMELNDDEARLVSSFFLLTSKPTLFACNVSEEELAGASADPDAHPHVGAVRSFVRDQHKADAVVICAAIESELVELDQQDAAEYLQGLGVSDSGVSKLIHAVYELLGLQTYLTTGEKETRAWTIRRGWKAPQAAGVIHTDFERGFIAAEIVDFETLSSLGAFSKAREAGKLRIEGKGYVMREGDVVEFRFNV